jgi:hypothetical protein
MEDKASCFTADEWLARNRTWFLGQVQNRGIETRYEYEFRDGPRRSESGDSDEKRLEPVAKIAARYTVS